MNIAYLITRFDAIGGAQIHVRDLATHFLEEGHEAHVLGGGGGSYAQQLGARGVPIHSVPYLARPIKPCDDVRALKNLRSVLRKLRPDLISTHSSKAGLLGRLVGRSLGVPTLFTAHGWAFSEGVSPKEAALYRLIEKGAAPLAAKIITVSEYDRRLALRHRIVSPSKMVAVHNGMPDVLENLRAKPEGEPARLVMVARFLEPKDHATLFRALAGLTSLPWQLDLIGDGPLEESAKHLAVELGLGERVRFHGLRNDVAEWLAGAQVFLLITNWEGFPRSILEAMRAGLPVVASDVGGISEAVIAGETGLLVPRADVGALREKLSTLLRDPQLRARLGAAGRTRFEAHFTFGRMLEKTLKVYKEVLAAP